MLQLGSGYRLGSCRTNRGMARFVWYTNEHDIDNCETPGRLVLSVVCHGWLEFTLGACCIQAHLQQVFCRSLQGTPGGICTLQICVVAFLEQRFNSLVIQGSHVRN